MMYCIKIQDKKVQCTRSCCKMIKNDNVMESDKAFYKIYNYKHISICNFKQIYITQYDRLLSLRLDWLGAFGLHCQ